MSHIVTVNSLIRDPSAIAAACQRLGLPAVVQGTAKLFSSEVTGLLVQLPDWHYPVVIDTHTGVIRYDNYNEEWGEKRHLDRFIQMYAVEMAKLEARKKGYTYSEELLRDGSIKLQINTGFV